MYDRNKIKGLILHLIKECEKGSEKMTITKLYKLLYFIEFGHYAMFGEAVLGLTFIKLPYGPVPYIIDKFLEAYETSEMINNLP